ncbi:glycosyltransferase family 2 protein [Candidatus Woesearchaeota archaeon]|nr:glycosyltransferase family 2 protein [Candidatus Woesearchaeota archaeon]
MTNFAVIPAYNETKHIQNVVQETKRYVKNIVVVDDGSKDNTYDLAQETGVIVLKNIVNLGKGATLRTGCDYAIKLGAKKIVVLDADAQHSPHKIPEFLKALDEYEIVFGYRELSESMPFILRFGNWFISKTTKLLYHLNLYDTQCGYRSFTSEAYNKIRWDASDYGMESEMITKVGKHKLKYYQIPLQTIYLDRYKGTTVVDGAKIIIKLCLWRLN